MSIVIEAHRVVTVCFGTDAIVEEAMEREASRGSATSVSRVLLLVGVLIKQLQPTLSRLAEQIDALEVAVMKGSNERMDDQAVLAGQQILALRRYVAPMYNELSYLALNPDELPGAGEPKYLRRAAELLARVVNALDSSYHRVQIMLDQLRSRDAARLEQSIHKLTLVATVFLPMGFITGLLGINVAGIPDAHDPVAFWVVCAALIGVAIASILLIRWRKWM